MTKTASAAATDSAMTRRAGLRLTRPGYPGRLEALPLVLLARRHTPAGNPVAVIVTEGAGRLIGEGVAVALAVGRPHERREMIPPQDLIAIVRCVIGLSNASCVKEIDIMSMTDRA